MYIRKLAAFLPLVAVLVGGMIALFVSAQEADACLPCYCEFNPPLNCFGGYAAYTHGDSPEVCEIEIAKVGALGYDELAISLSPAELAALPEAPEQHMLVGQYYEISLYKLTTGEFQINYGPDAESKVYVLNFTGCPAQNVYESHYVAGQ